MQLKKVLESEGGEEDGDAGKLDEIREAITSYNAKWQSEVATSNTLNKIIDIINPIS